MGLFYTASFTGQTITGIAADLFVVAPADDVHVTIHGLIIGQVTELAEQLTSQAEMIGISVLRNGTAGTGATSITPVAADRGNSTACAATVTGYSTAAGSGGTVYLRDALNVFNGYQMFWPEEFRPTVVEADTNLIVRLDAAPADPITFSGTLFLEEN